METVSLQEKINAFLSIDHGDGSGYGYGYGYGSGDGSGSGYGYGDGSGYGYGDGSGDGSDSGSGYGDGYGYGYGDGSGYGYGSGYGDGYGYGYGSGYGDGYGICMFHNMDVHSVDGLQTIIISVHKSVAKGFILNQDFTLSPCYVVKGNRLFAHGETLHEAMAALTDKLFDDMPEEERITAFINEHPDMDVLYSHKDLFDWHHRLTGSCEMGRKAFMRDNGFEMDGVSTIKTFIEATKNAYNGSVIKNLEEEYKRRNNK